MRYVKLFEQFIKEETMKPGEESEVTIDDITLEDGKTISSAEIVGVIVNSENEKQLEEYFFDKYGQNAFKQGELAEIKQKWNEWYAEQKEEEADAEKEEEAPAGAEAEAEAEAGAEDSEEGGDDIESELADLENM
jgi:hypothetical protein